MIEKGIYRHFKGNLYEVLFTALDCEDKSEVVVYKALYGENQIWVRKADAFSGTVTRDGTTFKRFEKVEL